MKIDVEGFETAVVRGGSKLFATKKPDVICEILPSSTRHQELDGMLRELGYQYFQINNSGLSRCESITP